MEVDKSLVFISYFSEVTGAEKSTCRSICTHLKPLQEDNQGLVVWDYSLIMPGDCIDSEIATAIQRCSIAVILMTPEYRASSQWKREAEPLLELAEQRRIRLLWQLISYCNCEGSQISAYKQMIPGRYISKERKRTRNELEYRISQIVFQAWKEHPVLSQSASSLLLQRINNNDSRSNSISSADSLALVLSQSGTICDDNIAYQWIVLARYAGKAGYKLVSKHAISEAIKDASASGKPLPELVTKHRIESLLQILKKWIDSNFVDLPILDIFAPKELLDEDWGSMRVKGEDSPLHTCQPYLLRSLDRLVLAQTEWKSRQGAFARMHKSLAAGNGVWMPENMVCKKQVLKYCDGRHNAKAKGVISAVCCLHPSIVSGDPSWLSSALESMVPLVVWPSQRYVLNKKVKEEEMRELLADLCLDLGSSPHCPDFTQLAKVRQEKARDADDWPNSMIDLVFRILVDQPDRCPGVQLLQALIPFPSQDAPAAASSAAAEAAQPAPQFQLFISP